MKKLFSSKSNLHLRYPRVARVNKLLREIVAEEIERLSDSDQRLSLLTVTDVATDPDLRHSKILFSSLTEQASEALEENRAKIQKAISTQVRMKRTPQLKFLVDDAIVSGQKIEAIIQKIHEE